ncbi:MAG: EscU/YscU/HrcU family type III secretion system export apparatus switch protein [Myxococcota bacterium]|nr:EscU/YscU/HrcU family type III secretion system export apparatus switch protein [Myxococcota bacterium]
MSGDKTEQPTARRLRKARHEGDSGASAHAAQAVAFLVAVAVLPFTVHALAKRATEDLRQALAQAGDRARLARFDPGELATTVLVLVSPVLVAAALAAAVVLAVQTGGVLATERLALRIERLSLTSGIKGLVSAARLFGVGRALLGGAVVAWLAWRGLSDHVIDLAHLSGRPRWLASVIADVAGPLAWRVALFGLALGALDVVVTRRSWRRRLMMTKDEIKREHREAEGDPHAKAARERAYHELLAEVAIASVRTASVVIVNPTHLACALRYDERGGDEAPVVVARGEGELAARILQEARDYGVPIVHDVPLARVLVELDVGDTIPEALYEAIAEILREVWEHDSPGP